MAVRRMAMGRSERSLLLTGLRGVGKTVLLNQFGSIAETEGWIHEHMEATEDVALATAVATMSRRILLELSLKERTRERATRALGALRSFIKVHVPVGDGSTLVIDATPTRGLADSGQLDGDLGALLKELGETAAEAGTGVLFTIDELQYTTRRELSALIVGLHRMSQLRLPVLVAGAGLPSLPGLAGEARSYAERLFAFEDIGTLEPSDARRALVGPVEDEGGRWSSSAVDRIISETQGYPYFLQEFGKQAWNVSDGPTITDEDVRSAIVLAGDDLDRGFFRARIDKTTDAERDYVRAMAGLGGPGPYRSGDVSRSMGRPTTQNGPVSDSLIKGGRCFAPRNSELACTVPMFDDFSRRTMP